MTVGSAHWGESHGARPGSRDRTQPASLPMSAEGRTSPDNQPVARGRMPFMDHWNMPHPHVSLRDIIKEEQALQKNVEKVIIQTSPFSLLHLCADTRPHLPFQPSFLSVSKSCRFGPPRWSHPVEGEPAVLPLPHH